MEEPAEKPHDEPAGDTGLENTVVDSEEVVRRESLGRSSAEIMTDRINTFARMPIFCSYYIPKISFKI